MPLKYISIAIVIIYFNFHGHFFYNLCWSARAPTKSDHESVYKRYNSEFSYPHQLLCWTKLSHFISLEKLTKLSMIFSRLANWSFGCTRHHKCLKQSFGWWTGLGVILTEQLLFFPTAIRDYFKKSAYVFKKPLKRDNLAPCNRQQSTRVSARRGLSPSASHWDIIAEIPEKHLLEENGK